MKINLMTASGQSANSTIEVSESTFGREFNEPLVHQVVTAYLSTGRAGTHAQKTRAQVSGGGRKPWKQKGSGRARSGTIRSPLWRGGGKTFAAVPGDYSQKINRKMFRGAISAIFSELLRQNRLIVVDTFSIDMPKTKTLVEKLKNFGGKEFLIIADRLDDNLSLAARNLHKVEVRSADNIDPVSLIAFEKVLVTADAIKRIEERMV